jgi:hypothetical protein
MILITNVVKMVRLYFYSLALADAKRMGWALARRNSSRSDSHLSVVLRTMCGHGYTMAAVKDSQYFAADLLHRLYHTVKIAEGIVDHYADSKSWVNLVA